MGKNKNILGIIALICGILAVLSFSGLFFARYLALLGPVLASIAVICGYLGRRKRKKGRTMATVGLILGLLWWCLTIILMIIGSLTGFLSEITSFT